MTKTHGEKWLDAAMVRLRSYCKTRGFTITEPVRLPYSIRYSWYWVGVRDYTGHRCDVEFCVDGYRDHSFEDGEPLSAENFDKLTPGLVRKDPVSKRQLVLPLEATQ